MTKLLSSCQTALVSILTAPTLALIYALSIYCMSVISLDIDWYDAKQAVFPFLLRIAVWIAALASCLALCQKNNDDDDDITVAKYAPIAGIFTAVSLWLIYQSRKWDVVGGPPPKLPPNCMKDKVVLVTGANTGIGKEITLQLLQLGATVIMACRNMDKARQARQELLSLCSTTTTSEDQLRIVIMDLAKLTSVREAVKQMEEWKLPLHVLINNAGIMMATKETSEDGYELVMQANHLGHYLLTRLLLSKLLQQPQQQQQQQQHSPATNDNDAVDADNDHDHYGDMSPRVINLTSSVYKMCHRMDLDDLFCERRGYTLFGQYSQSKLANILFTLELSRRYSSSSSSNIVHDDDVNGDPSSSLSSSTHNNNNNDNNNNIQSLPLLTWAVHPGVVRTEVMRNMHWYFRLGNYLLGSYIATLSKRPSQGAWGAVLCAASRDPPPNATYLRNGRVQKMTPATRFDEDAKKLWELSERLVGLASADGDEVLKYNVSSTTSNGSET